MTLSYVFDFEGTEKRRKGVLRRRVFVLFLFFIFIALIANDIILLDADHVDFF
jgi:hypothetical protein